MTALPHQARRPRPPMAIGQAVAVDALHQLHRGVAQSADRSHDLDDDDMLRLAAAGLERQLFGRKIEAQAVAYSFDRAGAVDEKFRRNARLDQARARRDNPRTHNATPRLLTVVSCGPARSYDSRRSRYVWKSGKLTKPANSSLGTNRCESTALDTRYSCAADPPFRLAPGGSRARGEASIQFCNACFGVSSCTVTYRSASRVRPKSNDSGVRRADALTPVSVSATSAVTPSSLGPLKLRLTSHQSPAQANATPPGSYRANSKRRAASSPRSLSRSRNVRNIELLPLPESGVNPEAKAGLTVTVGKRLGVRRRATHRASRVRISYGSIFQYPRGVRYSSQGSLRTVIGPSLAAHSARLVSDPAVSPKLAGSHPRHSNHAVKPKTAGAQAQRLKAPMEASDGGTAGETAPLPRQHQEQFGCSLQVPGARSPEASVRVDPERRVSEISRGDGARSQERAVRHLHRSGVTARRDGNQFKSRSESNRSQTVSTGMEARTLGVASRLATRRIVCTALATGMQAANVSVGVTAGETAPQFSSRGERARIDLTGLQRSAFRKRGQTAPRSFSALVADARGSADGRTCNGRLGDIPHQRSIVTEDARHVSEAQAGIKPGPREFNSLCSPECRHQTECWFYGCPFKTGSGQ